MVHEIKQRVKRGGRRVLDSKHASLLLKRGISQVTAERNHIYSDGRPGHFKELFGYEKPFTGKAMFVPYHFMDDTKNEFAIARPDRPSKDAKGHAKKYLCPLGKEAHVYFPVGQAKKLLDPKEPLFVTESPIKAIALVEHGYTAVGVIGCWGWQEKRERDVEDRAVGPRKLLDGFDELPLKDRELYLVFDSDTATNSNVQWGEYFAALSLGAEGAIVHCVRLPMAEDGAKVGVDDYLATHATSEFDKLVASAVEPSKPIGKSVDPYPAATEFLKKEFTVDGVLTLRRWQGDTWTWNGRCWVVISEEELRSKLVNHLSTKTAINSTVISNVMLSIHAQCQLGSEVEQPSWMAEPGPWPANEVSVTTSGMLHLPTMTPRTKPKPLAPNLFTANALPYSYDPKAKCPRWLEFLRQLWPKDNQSIQTLQDWFGYCLTGDTRQQKILMLIGPRRGGKGTIARILAATVGAANVCGPTLAQLGTNFGLSGLLGKSVAIISDARMSFGSDMSVVVERLLAISGEDLLTIDRKYGSLLTARLKTRITMLTNELPKFSDTSGALASRFILLALKESWQGKENINLTNELKEELPGILNWAIAGYKRLVKRKYLVQPKSGEELGRELEDLSSPTSTFIKERCITGAGAEVPVDALFKAWIQYCKAKGWEHHTTAPTFGRDLRTVLPRLTTKPRRIGGKRLRAFIGVALRDDIATSEKLKAWPRKG
jgi:putative DNA primase/helicase